MRRHSKWYIRSGVCSCSGCIERRHCQNTLHTLYMHGALCRGSPDHGMLVLQSCRNASCTRRICICSHRGPRCGIVTVQLDQMSPDTKNTCNDPSFLLCCGLHPMSPFHECCNALSECWGSCNSRNILCDCIWMGMLVCEPAVGVCSVPLCWRTSPCNPGPVCSWVSSCRRVSCWHACSYWRR